jgi:PAS domain S-box-containing protein
MPQRGNGSSDVTGPGHGPLPPDMVVPAHGHAPQFPPLPRRRLRTLLLSLVLAVLLPSLVLGVLATYHVVSDERDLAQQGLHETADILAFAVDRELTGHIAALQGLAISPAFGPDPASPDLPALYSQARRLADQLGITLNVLRRDDTHLLTTARPLGAALPVANAKDLVARVFATGLPAVSDLVVGAVSGARAFSVGVPVRGADGKVALVITGSHRLTQLRDLILSQHLPAGQTAGVLDSRHALLASTAAPQGANIGRTVPQANARRYASAEEGIFRSTDLYGQTRVFAFHAVSAAPGWTVVLSQSSALLDASWRRPLLAVGAAGAVAMAFGIGLALLTARRMLVPLRLLGAHARAIATSGGALAERADAGTLAPAPVAEIEELRRAFITAEKALLRREAGLRALLNASPAGMVHLDTTGRVLATNDVFPRMLGVSREDLLATRWDWNAMTPPEWRGVTERAIATAIADPHGTGSPFENEFVRPDGSRLPVLESFALLEPPSPYGAPGRLAGFIVDLTEIRRSQARLAESEARFRTLTDAMPQLIWSARPDGQHDYFNARCYAFSGGAEGTLDGDAWAGLVHPDDRARLAERWRQSLRTGELYEIEYRLRRHDGAYRWMLVRALPMRGAPNGAQPQGAILRWFGSSTDITEIVDAREVVSRSSTELERLVEERTQALQAVQAQLVHAARTEALGQLAAGIAHDFNNVLQAVRGGIALIERRPDDHPGVQRLCRLAMEAADRGAAVTSRLLAFSRHSDLRTEPVNTASLLLGTKDILTHTLGAGIQVVVEAPATLPPLLADKGQLETVLVNLATNARDAMAGNGTLTLAAEARTRRPEDGADRKLPLKAGLYIRLSVSDTGAGMDAATAAHATEPFFTTKPRGQGTGLGLAMAHGFAEQSGGALHIESALGQGTTISIWLPMAEAAAAQPDRAEGGEPPGLRGRTARLLLVDDDATVREVVAGQMEAADYTVVAVESAAAALAVLHAGESVDLILSDLSMPNMDGVALIREAQRRRPGLPAILLTGFTPGAPELAVGGAVSGSFSLLCKPIDGRHLADRVAGLLQGAQAPG